MVPLHTTGTSTGTAILPCYLNYKTGVLIMGEICVRLYVPWGLGTASKFGEEKIIYGTPVSYRCEFF